MKPKPAQRQIRLAVTSNAGGSGKTTLITHLAYAIGALGYKVVIIELDHNGSLCVYAGVQPVSSEKSMAAVFKKTFKGGYPLIPLWENRVPNVAAILGGAPLEESFTDIYSAPRKYYTLKDRLEDHPLDADLILIDTPATLEPMGQVMLAAATHLIAAIKPVHKDTWSMANLVYWYYEKLEELRLRPRPKIIGCVPSHVDLSKAIHREILGVDRPSKARSSKPSRRTKRIEPEETLPYQLQQHGIAQFPNIRYCDYYLHAAKDGVPLYISRPGCEFVEDFKPIVEAVVDLMTEV